MEKPEQRAAGAALLGSMQARLEKVAMRTVTVAFVLLVVGVAFFAGLWIGQTSNDAGNTVSPDIHSVLMEHDSRPIVALFDGETGTIDNWEVTAGFLETTAPYGYGKRRVDFGVHIEWKGDSPPDELMMYTFLESSMLFVSPSGETATVHLSGDWLDDEFDGTAFNGSDSLPDEPGTFYLTFGPHPNKQRLVWAVDLPYLS